MVLQKIEVQATFQDQISAGVQQAIEKMEELQISTASVAQAYERLNKAQGLYTQGSNAAAAATATLQAQSQNLGTTIQKTRTHLFQMSLQSKQTAASLRKAKIDETFSDEVSARIQNALDTMVEFGASTKEVEKATRLLNKTQKDGIRGTAQQANVLRTLADESENAEFALKNMEKATKIATQTGLKLEDAGRQLGMAFRGDATILRNFDEMARKAADAIEKMNNPAQRQVAIMRELERAQRRTSGGFGKLQNSIARANVSLNKVGLSVRSLSLGIVGLIGAIGAAGILGAKSAVDEYIKSSPEMKRVNDELEKSTKALQAALGEQIAKMLNLKKEMQDASDFSKGLAKDIKKLGNEQDETLKKSAALTNQILALSGVGPAKAIQSLGLLRGEFETVGENAAFASSRIFGMTGALEAMNATIQKTMGKGLAGVVGPAMQAATKFVKEEVARVKAAGAENAKTLEILKDIEAKMYKIGKYTPGRKKGPGGGRGGRRKRSEFDMILDDAKQRSIGKKADLSEFSKQMDQELRQEQELINAIMGVEVAMGGAVLATQRQTDALAQQIEMTRKLQAGYRDAGGAVTQFAKGALRMAIDATSQLFEGLAAGEFSLANFGRSLLNTTADLLGQMGQAFILMGAGIDNIKTGILSPGALIAIGVGMVALSGAIKGFASKGDTASAGGGAGAGGGTAAALERFGRRIFERGDADQGREVTINIEGRSMRGFVLDVAADGARRGSVPLTPRRV